MTHQNLFMFYTRLFVYYYIIFTYVGIPLYKTIYQHFYFYKTRFFIVSWLSKINSRIKKEKGIIVPVKKAKNK